MMDGMFDGFAEDRVNVGDGVELRVRHGGTGAPVVLLHGHPRTHTTWYRVRRCWSLPGTQWSVRTCAGMGSRRNHPPTRITPPTPSGRWQATSSP